MAQLIDIRKVTIGPRSLTAEVRIDDDAPLFTSDDPEGTLLVSELIPQLADHACFGDGGQTFGDVMDNTELAHLLEHVTVELLARTNRAGELSAGQTRAEKADARLFELRFACPDDVLVAGALSSASWILGWAYNGGGEPAPDVDAIAQGLADLVDSLAPAPEEAPEPAPIEDDVDPNATVATAPLNLDDLEPVADEPAIVPEAPKGPEEDARTEPEPAGEADGSSDADPGEDQQDALALPLFDI